MHSDHGQFDQVGCSTLHGGVNGGPFGTLATALLTSLEIGEPQATAEDRFYIAVLVRGLSRLFHVARNAGVTIKVAIDIGLRGTPFNAELFGQAKGTHTVDQTKVNGFGGAALVVIHFERHHTKYFSSRGAVNVFTLSKGAEQTVVSRQVRHDA